MRERRFRQVDVFSAVPFGGNPVAVVVDADDVTAEEMQTLARWTNLSETTFLLPPSEAGADYAVRIFTPSVELPFAGHPTLGSCHAWLGAGGTPHDETEIVQQCGIGLVRVRRSAGALSFAAPPMIRSGDVDDDTVARLLALLRLERDDVVAVQWVDNGPGWVGLLLRDADAVLAVEPDHLDGFYVGLVGPLPQGSTEAFEVRAFFPKGATTAEDPVTGSLNASLAQWFLGAGIASAPYRIRQGTALGRRGVVAIEQSPDGDIWVGGATTTCVSGVIVL